MPLAKIIAVDGPAGSGKSTLGQRLAEHLGYLYFDTGVMYRAVTLAALNEGIDPGDENISTQLAESVDIDVRAPSQNDGRSYDVILDGKDATWEIRRADVEASVSIVATFAGVRKALTRQQRSIGLRGKVVMVGRDIGTVVLPEADLKIYLDASISERARRRYSELIERGEKVLFEDVLKSMTTRDRIDSSREIAPLRPADDAVVIDSDRLDADQVLQTIITLLEEAPSEY
jgi:CMP/dCMP kinase